MELNKYDDIDSKDIFFREMIRSYLKKIHVIETIKQAPLTEKEISNRIKSFNSPTYRFYVNNRTKYQ
jgi:hypothetical protein